MRSAYSTREGGDGDIFDGAEERAIARGVIGIGFEDDRADRENDERDQPAMDDCAPSIADAAAVEQNVNAATKAGDSSAAPRRSFVTARP